MTLLRVYEGHELGADGYPIAWHRCPGCAGTGWRCARSGGPADLKRGTCCCSTEPCPSRNGCPDCFAPDGCGGTGSIKRLVRALAEDRCVRCRHPYVCGKTPAEWSPCDRRCIHGGPIRAKAEDVPWTVLDAPPHPAGEFVDVLRGMYAEARWRVLTVHHLDGNKSNCRWWNLAALCQRCHLTIQGRVRMERTWPWEHSDWFKPYAAGYYAWTYLGEDLDRPATLARLDELLELERVA